MLSSKVFIYLYINKYNSYNTKYFIKLFQKTEKFTFE